MTARIPYPDLDAKSQALRDMVAVAPINVMHMMAAASEGVALNLGNFTRSFYRASNLPADLREIGILRAGYVAQSDYETWQHESIARSIGFTDAMIDAIKAGKAPPGVMNPMQEAVLTFADEVVVKGSPSDAALATVRSHLPDDQMLDLVLVTGLYMMISRFLNTTGVERDANRGPIDAKFLSETTA